MRDIGVDVERAVGWGEAVDADRAQPVEQQLPVGRVVMQQRIRLGDGFRCERRDGAFYVYADISHLTTDSLSFCSKLLNDTGVAIAPGIDFDTVRGGSFVRLSFAGPTSDIEEAVRRIGSWLGD